jgi:hypothetical protein
MVGKEVGEKKGRRIDQLIPSSVPIMLLYLQD